MSDLQTFLGLVVLIYVLCVIVQGVQEIVKAILNTKAKTMEQAITEFMGDHLELDQVKHALDQRGLKIQALEHFSKDDFRRLLDGVQFTAQQIAQISSVVALPNATVDQLKDSIAASYDGARAKFQRMYAANNKQWVFGISLAVVLILNASAIQIYNVLAVNETLSQAIVGTASPLIAADQSGQNASTSQTNDPAAVYEKSRAAISSQIGKYPILLRTREYPNDFKDHPVYEVIGLLLMGALVSLGAPFWNDVLKGATGLNNALNGAGKTP